MINASTMAVFKLMVVKSGSTRKICLVLAYITIPDLTLFELFCYVVTY